MLQIRHLTLTHRRDLRVLLRDFSLVLNPGDKAVVIGEEGNGKSSLLRWICDPALVSPYLESEGERVLDGRAAYLPQKLEREDREKSAAEFFAARESFWNASQGELRRAARELGFSPELYYSEQRMASFSGGERVKLQMAGLLLDEPDILLLDEPSNDLDIETLEWLERRILDFPGIVLYVSHDETLIENTANTVILLEQLRHKTECRWSVERMGYAEFSERRRRGLDKQRQMAYSERREDRRAMEKFRRIQQRVEHEQETISRADPAGGRLLKKKMASVKAMERRYERERGEMTEIPITEDAINIRMNRPLALPAGRSVLELELPELRTEDGGRLLARNIALRVQGPEKIVIIGRNGAGKTTLLRRIERAISERPNLHPAVMPQDHLELLDGELTPVELLAPSGRKEDATEARTCLGSLRYTAQEMERPIRSLSGGQKAKLLLLRLALTETDLLLLDEPTRNFSPLSGPEIRAMLRAFPGAIISASHDRKYIAEVCDTVYRLTENGLLRE